MKNLPEIWHIIVDEHNIKTVMEVAKQFHISFNNIKMGTVVGKYVWLADSDIHFYGKGPFMAYTNGEPNTNSFSFGERIPNRVFIKHFSKKRKTLNDE